ncbi:MAG TPA: metallopeptidase (SprT family) [Gammaproteobacteria bacterium]|nr:metallopeptidase (SprT family) [Gammaproteobacteria bacterium]
MATEQDPDAPGEGQAPVQPIGEEQRQQVEQATADWLQRAGELYGTRFPLIPVAFDLMGRCAGMYRVRRGRRCIRYNPWLFARYFEDSLAQTVPHEVAHYVTDALYGIRNVRPHGAEWRAIMRSLGVEPRASGQYDLQGIPVRRQQRHRYRCGCDRHLLSSCRHNRIRRGEARYLCRRCGQALVIDE